MLNVIAQGSMKKIKILLLLLALIFISSCAHIITKVGGNFFGEPQELDANLTGKAKDLIAEAFKDVDPKKLVDFHTHMLGMGTNGAETYVNPEMMSIWHPFKYFQFLVYTSAGGIKNLDQADAEYISRLKNLIDAMPIHGKYMIMAFDKLYTTDREADLRKTHFYVSNSHVFKLAKERPDIFSPMISIHPYRKDAVEALEKWHKKGARFIKWLPNSMGIDPAHEMNDPFYKKALELNMVLLAHTGEEGAVGETYPEYGNPLRFERALEMGLTIIMAHCAGLGMYEDPATGKKVSGFELFLRLMKKYKGQLYGELSAMTQYNRFDEHQALRTLLERKDLHPWLVNGSDYPLPAINFLIQTRSLVNKGFITAEEREALNLIYGYNPLLFDYVLKRTLRHPETGQKFPPSIFMSPFAQTSE